LICLVALWLERRVRVATAIANRIVLGIAVLAAVGVVVATGNPVTWVGDRTEEVLEGEAPDLSENSSRLTLNASSGRSEIWGVAVDVSQDAPVLGEGGGGFQFRFTQDRDEPGRFARDAHSVELEMLSELGVVGLVLFCLALLGAFAGAIRARKLGPAAASLSCGALAAATYWLAHASIDWFWPYPAVTACAFALLGAAVAPSLPLRARDSRRSGRRPLIAAVVVFVVLLVPPLLSELLVERSFDTFRSDTEQAYDDLELARDLNPLSDQPALSEGSIALALGQRERAIDAFEEAIRERPEEYAGHFFLALLLSRDDPDEAKAALAVVEELNPLEPRIDEIRARIEKAESARPG
jgi:tetratricopeptide (TPR) repeat protein